MGGIKHKLTTLFRPSDDGTLVSTSLKITLSLMIGLTGAVLAVYMANDSYRQTLTSRVQTVAYALPSDIIANAIDDIKNGSSGQAGALLNQKLNNIKNSNQDLSFTYIMGLDQNRIYFVADGEQPGSDDYSAPGSTFNETTADLYNIFYSGGTVIEGPVKDKWGEWFSALSPVYDSKTGEIIAVIGFDVPSMMYYRALAVAAFLPLFAGVIIGSIFWLGDRRRKSRRDALRFKSELVSIASHELRTPLTGIRWGEEALMKQKLGTKQTEIMTSMYDSTLRLQESIEDILQLANWQAGRNQELRISPLDIHAIFAGIFAIQKLPAEQRGISLEFSADWPDELIIQCDMQRIKRVFNNLVSNAIKYARPNTVVTIDYKRVDGQHLISIVDEGIGIPISEQEKVFQGFYRATNAIKHEAGGTGMGLYMSRTVIEQHGGKMWLKSVENKGTTAYIQLP